MNYRELENMLKERSEEVCGYLLPNGKRKGREWTFGSIYGEAGESSGVCLSGDDTGKWNDFANSETRGTTLVSLWCKVRCGGDFLQTMKEVKEYLGVKDETPFGRKIEKHYSRPSRKEQAAAKKVEEKSLVMKYLQEERGLTPETIEKLKICQSKDDSAYIFPYYDDEGLAMTKTVLLERKSGKKHMWSTKDAKSVLFGKPAVPPTAGYIIVTEGEIDCASWAQYGFPAVSIPQGASNDSWIENEWTWLDRFETIYLNFDSDDAGQKGAKHVASRLGYDRVKNVVFDIYKDANEMLVKCEDCPDRFLHDAKDLRPPEIQSFFDDWDRHVVEYDKYMLNPPGIVSPWIDLKWRIRRKEVTAVSGYTSHGKALSLDTLIPTPSGLRTMGELNVGDKVIGDDGLATNITYVSPVFVDHECFKIKFDDGTTVIADSDHRWLVETVASRVSDYHARARSHIPRTGNDQRHKKIRPSVITTKQMFEGQKIGERNNFSIPVAATIIGSPSIYMPVKPYTLGAWLGDGCTMHARFTCHIKSNQILDEITSDGYTVVSHKHDENSFGIRGLIKGLREANLIGNKHIPEIYMTADYKTRFELLQGLMDTDGCITPYGRSEFCTIKKDLAKSVLRLVRSLGIKATICEGDATISGRFISRKYRVMFTTDKKIFRLKYKLARVNKNPSPLTKRRMIVSVEKVESVKTKCIAVDNASHLYLCTESNIITHNTAAMTQLVCHLQANGLKGLLASLEMETGATKHNITSCILGAAKLSLEQRKSIQNHPTLRDLLLVVQERGRSMNSNKILENVRLCVKRYGIDYFVLDNMMMCEVRGDDYDSQRDFVLRLQDLAIELDIHVFLVSHPRKPPMAKDLDRPPDIYDMKGASEMANLTNNFISVWRNITKHRKMAELKRNMGNGNDDFGCQEQYQQLTNKPDGIIALSKQRGGFGDEQGWQGEAKVWMKAGKQFVCSMGLSATNYVQEYDNRQKD